MRVSDLIGKARAAIFAGRAPASPAAREEPVPDPTPDDYARWMGAHEVSLAEIGRGEGARIRARRKALAAVGAGRTAPVAGLALSGGGIRSATFSLGLLREFAAQGLLHRFDYLSTVSGGSYVGAYYCGLFASRGQVPPVLTAHDFPDPFARRDGLGRASLDWLRQSGRYLAPSGAGDYWHALGLLVRNWIGLHLVIGTTLMLGALIAVGWRLLVYGGGVEPGFHLDALLWFAPLLIFLALPIGAHVAFAWAYWLTKRDVRASSRITAGVTAAQGGSMLIAALGIAIWYARPLIGGDRNRIDGIAMVVALFAVAALVLLALSLASAKPGADDEAQWDSRRAWLTWPMRWCAAAFATVLVAGLADGVGFWIYRLSYDWRLPAGLLPPALAAALVPAGRWLVSRLLQIGGSAKANPPSTGKPEAAKPPFLTLDLFLRLAAALTATLLIVATAAFWIVLAYKATWPVVPAPPATVATAAQAAAPARAAAIVPAGDAVHCPQAATEGTVASPWSGCDRRGVSWFNVATIWACWAGALAFLSLCIAATPAFLNLSGLTSFYAGRLRRAYLGAGNRKRLAPDGETETEQRLDRWEEHDDVLLDASDTNGGYFAPGSAAPLHLINVTLNETRGTGTNIIQRDRHGRNLVVSPEGIYYESDRSGTVDRILFSGDEHEQLPLSTWIAISGAAFSTGLGNRTGFPLTQLAGLANVRLGYWWRARSRRVGAPTQIDLLREFRGDFSGPSGKYWYLSDGGHFENTGAYELLRRKLPFIVISDNGMDERFEYEDVANLVRKARIDFDCEVDFVGGAALDDIFGPGNPLRESFGTLLQIAGAKPAARKAVAALARVRYGNDTLGTLILIKPRLTGDGPADLIRYKAANRAFPQQTTIDQFFDEAQWESYYHLGRLIAQAVFGTGPPPDAPDGGTRWSPASLHPHFRPRS